MEAKKKHIDTVNEPSGQVYQTASKSNISKILDLAKKLSNSEILQLTKKLDVMVKKQSELSSTNFSSFLLSGPVMDDTQFESFLKERKDFNQWRKK
ncbi:hypothetical protein SAMN04489724_0646 [Algoriphagus locisalis]|uniref:Uncharacterized protein n=1 Tax=Algoriphagus locisalis TaxID=305507 RepID=A0A1I6XTV5_9BACT|nr:hypothetical protein [Algoriphagus locisalis]SFT41301.1 hypothetical protein SAMN04489724_0646 [Algoriphagus locisalis]